jgi:hypothetical protein
MICPVCTRLMTQTGINEKEKPIFACVNTECKGYVDISKPDFTRKFVIPPNPKAKRA